MCCECCSVTQRKIWVFGSGTLFAALGILMLVLWPSLSKHMVQKNLILKPGTETYDNWLDAPLPIYLQFSMFNWTNPEMIRHANVKPHFEELGPYVFLEKRSKENIQFHDNSTVSYNEKKTWFFQEELSNGKLSDMITTGHAITASVVEMMRSRNKLVKKVINFMLNREGGALHVTKPVSEWLFDGFEDKLIDFLKYFNYTKIDIPYKKFGWMVERNNSAEFEGLYSIYTGVDDISNVGQLSAWNGKQQTGYYEQPCGTVNGTTGDIFAPEMDSTKQMTIFTTDACRYLNLVPDGTIEHLGVEATNWAGTEETLDSGDKFPNQKCFCDAKHEECPKAGVVDCAKCRSNAPIYASFPHFYLADPSYIAGVDGLAPNVDKHKFNLAVEPSTGIPVKVNARLQINMMITPDSDIDLYKDIPKFLMPIFWFEQKVELDDKLASRTKLALNLKSYGIYAGIALVALGGIFYIVGLVLCITNRWKRAPSDDEDMLTNN